jgi:GTP cyclohydrolase I
MERLKDDARNGVTPAAAGRIDCITTDPIHAEPTAVEAITGDEVHAYALRRVPGGDGVALGDASMREIYAEILRRVDADPTRDGLLRTPERMEKSMAFLTRGYGQTLEEVVHGALFDVVYDEMVIVRDIEFYSMCEHHLLPFFGRAHIAYVPSGKVIGLSKLPRLVDMFARRLQVQERLTRQVADAIIETIQPQGVGVILEAQHLCMMMRGVEKQSSMTTTSAMLGVFRTQTQTRNEFLSLMRRPGSTT